VGRHKRELDVKPAERANSHSVDGISRGSPHDFGMERQHRGASRDRLYRLNARLEVG